MIVSTTHLIRLNFINHLLLARCSKHNNYTVAASVTSGVPQGSVLGTLLLLTFINDLPNSIESTCCLFADDYLLYLQIDSKHDTEILQNDQSLHKQPASLWETLLKALLKSKSMQSD